MCRQVKEVHFLMLAVSNTSNLVSKSFDCVCVNACMCDCLMCLCYTSLICSIFRQDQIIIDNATYRYGKRFCHLNLFSLLSSWFSCA